MPCATGNKPAGDPNTELKNAKVIWRAEGTAEAGDFFFSIRKSFHTTHNIKPPIIVIINIKLLGFNLVIYYFC